MEDIRSGTCPLCAHNQIIGSAATDISVRPGSHYGGQTLLAQAIAYEFKTQDEEVTNVYGRIFRYTCRRCGFTQAFVMKPEEIPIDKEKYRTWLIDGPAPAGPYRTGAR